jgi:toxin-antitoxin system PIN domain toxin
MRWLGDLRAGAPRPDDRAGRSRRRLAGDPSGWATCPVTESGFVRASSNPKVLPTPIGVDAARGVPAALRSVEGHSFLADDVSLGDADFPRIVRHRQVTDGHLLTLARRRGTPIVTLDAALLALAEGRDVELLTVL